MLSIVLKCIKIKETKNIHKIKIKLNQQISK